ncbi:unnamed protein product, partial [Pylaiella littoralis]
EEEEQEDEHTTFSVVFMTQSLGITLAAATASHDDDDIDGSGSLLVVCDKEEKHAATTPTSQIRIGDRLIAVEGTSIAGLDVGSVERMIVRGSRPLEMVFRRRQQRPVSSGGAGLPATAATNLVLSTYTAMCGAAEAAAGG